jgi:catechol 2,3-dioxygenase-like lactoylglutathione lyase family enzyme
MKRFHVHVGVENLDASIAFYSGLFGQQPSVVKADYAKWMLDDPRVNFAISHNQTAGKGIEHLGLQVDDEAELAEVYGRLEAAGRPVLEEGATTCCYAKSEKSWIAEATVYGAGPNMAAVASAQSANAAATSCCAPAVEATKRTACN